MKNGLLRRSLRRQGFTLIEILVVIVIIGILATMGIGKYAQFSRDARKQSCVSNQNTIEKGVGMWEAKYVAIRTPAASSKHTINFFEDGKISAVTGSLPSRLTNFATKPDQIFDMIQDDVVFVCPETVSAWSGIENITNKGTVEDYTWIMNARGDSNKDTNNKLRGVGCLVWGTVAPDSTTAQRGPAGEEVPGGDGTSGPSGSDEDLHSGTL